MKSRLLYVLFGAFIYLFITGCSNLPTPTPKLDLQESIRYFIYEYQPTSGEDFVSWAKENLTRYSHREIATAIYREGEYQAEKGHPNAVASLSNAAKVWAEDQHLSFDLDEWYALQKVALANRRQPPPEDFRVWPPGN